MTRRTTISNNPDLFVADVADAIALAGDAELQDYQRAIAEADQARALRELHEIDRQCKLADQRAQLDRARAAVKRSRAALGRSRTTQERTRPAGTAKRRQKAKAARKARKRNRR